MAVEHTWSGIATGEKLNCRLSIIKHFNLGPEILRLRSTPVPIGSRSLINKLKLSPLFAIAQRPKLFQLPPQNGCHEKGSRGAIAINRFHEIIQSFFWFGWLLYSLLSR